MFSVFNPEEPHHWSIVGISVDKCENICIIITAVLELMADTTVGILLCVDTFMHVYLY